MGSIDQQALLITCRRLEIDGFRFLQLFRLDESFRIFLQNATEQFIGLVFFRMLLDDLLQHLDRFAALVSKNEAGRQFLARVSIVRLKLEHSQIKRDGLLHLLRRRVIIRRVLQDRRVARSEGRLPSG